VYPTDEELLARHVRGSPDAFGELVRRHRDRLWAVALRTLGDPEEAADAVQDALVSAFRRAHTFRGDAAVTTWLHRIVVNACLDRVRRRQARPTLPLSDQEADAGPRRVFATSPDHAPDGDLRLEVAAALAELPMEQRAALVLVDMQGYSVEEAARILEVAAGTIKSRCARGRARLLPHLAHLRGAAAISQRVAGPERADTKGPLSQQSADEPAGPGRTEAATEPAESPRSRGAATAGVRGIDSDERGPGTDSTDVMIGGNPDVPAPVKPASTGSAALPAEPPDRPTHRPTEGGDPHRAS
jgi:RNA polymerase sigma-70 factor (ECF subfamily)